MSMVLPRSSKCSIVSAYESKPRVSVSFPEVSEFTRQEFKDECDINRIMSRYLTSGELPSVAQLAPQYLDVSAGHNYQEAMFFVAQAQSLFNQLPSALRTRFGNDPKQFVDFCSNDKNRDEMQELGLLNPAPEVVVPTAVVEPVSTVVEPTPS